LNNTPPPNNLEYEQTVLGSVLFRPELFPNVAESLKPDAFYRSDHELIFKAMSAVMAEGRFPDVISVHQYLKAEHPTEGITAHFLIMLIQK